jgi:hypothetical protein
LPSEAFFLKGGQDKMSMRSTLIIVMIIYFVCHTAFYQVGAVPALINYQGELRDSEGRPLDDIYEMEFRVFDVEKSGDGEALWGERQLVDVNSGIYNVLLGAGAKITSGDELGPTIFSSGDRWLEVRIKNKTLDLFETLKPRQRISSVAFAFRAAEALYAETAGDSQSLDGRDASDFADSVHSHSGADINSGTIPASRIPSSIARDSEITWGNLSGIPSDISDGDQVGISDETDPTITNLSIKDGVSWSELSGIPDDFDDGIDNVGLTAESDPQVGSNAFQYVPKWNGSELIKGTIYDNGKIGIGLSNPMKKLHVGLNSQDVEYALKLENENKFFNSGVGILFAPGGDGPNRGKGALVYDYTNTWNRGNFHFLQRSDDNYKLVEMSNSVMTVANNGRVGIGTTNPNEKLHVIGNAKVTSDLIVNGAVRGNIGPNNGAPFPRPAYDSGWIEYNQDECKKHYHEVGGDVNKYVVDMQFKDDEYYGINQYGIGYNIERDVPAGGDRAEGGAWTDLTSSSIWVCRGNSDEFAPKIRLRIWLYN